jgi:hypothetical protein
VITTVDSATFLQRTSRAHLVIGRVKATAKFKALENVTRRALLEEDWLQILRVSHVLTTVWEVAQYTDLDHATCAYQGMDLLKTPSNLNATHALQTVSTVAHPVLDYVTSVRTDMD